MKIARKRIFNAPAKEPMDAMMINKGSEIVLGSIVLIQLLNKINKINVIIEENAHIANAHFQNCCCAVLLFEY